MAVLDLYFAVLASGVRLCLYLAAEALVLRLAFPAAALVFAFALLTPDLVFAFAFWPALVAAADIFFPRSVFLYPLYSFIFRPFFFNLAVEAFALLLIFERLVGVLLSPVGSGFPCLTDLRCLDLALFILAFFMNLPKPIIGHPNL